MDRLKAIVKTYEHEAEAHREENARLREVEAEAMALVLNHEGAIVRLTRERDEARAEVARLNGIWERAEHRCPQCGTPNERLRRAEVEVARLEVLILDWSSWPVGVLEAEARRIRGRSLA